jgi:carbon monoxide dehydrogenase subunit G
MLLLGFRISWACKVSTEGLAAVVGEHKIKMSAEELMDENKV